MTDNLFEELPHSLRDELSTDLVESPCVRIERIVSTGQASPPGFYYDQERDEWVVVLRGSAWLELEGRENLVEMGPGDWIHLPAHQRHRVAKTSTDEPTVWLAVHFEM